MQAIAPVTNADLLAAGQRPLMKLEIYVAAAWVNICTLGGKNYLKDISFSSGGARMTADPIAGQFSAIINNEGNIFHPNHPTSAYTAYFQAGRKVRISLGGNYTVGGIKYWQRIIGYMDEPEFASDKYELSIKGLDYMKVLSDMKFNKKVWGPAFSTPIDNYWGALATLNSVSTTQYGPELYDPPGGDAAGDKALGYEADNVLNWAVRANGGTGYSSQAQIGGFSDYEIEFIAWPIADARSVIEYRNVCAVVAGQEYYVTFKYCRTAGDDKLRFSIRDNATLALLGGAGPLDPVTGVWETGSFSFTPTANGNIDIWLVCHVFNAGSTWRIDNISIKSVTGKFVHKYDMPVGCTGIYYVELDEGAGFEPQWPGKQKGEGWYYDLDLNQFYFDEDKIVDAGVANLLIYYFEAQALEDVVADIIVKAGLYANRAAALAAMDAPATGVSIDRVWFEAGWNFIKAIRMICERCNWRFYFNWNGSPVFIAAPSAGAPVFTTFNPQHFTSPRLYQNKNEIWNRIVIEGEKVAELVGWEDNMPSELKDEANDAASIAAYGERTKSIKNHLFQDQTSITNMCITLLAAYKDPKWCFDFETPYNAVPLELGDTIWVEELLDIALPIAQRYVKHTCLIRNADISQYSVTYKSEIGGIMIELLASIDNIDLNALGETVLFTVPAGRGCIITKVVMRNADGAVVNTLESFGWNSGDADDVIANANRTLTGATNYEITLAKSDAVRGVATSTFKIDVNTVEGGARTCTVDVFGYLYWP